MKKKPNLHQHDAQTACTYIVRQTGKAFFKVGGVEVKVCGLEQFDPCNDRGLWYGSTCQRSAFTDPCCSQLQSM